MAREPESEDDKDESGYAGTGDDNEFTDPTPFLKPTQEPPVHSASSPSSSPADHTSKAAPGYYKHIMRDEVEDPGYYKIVVSKEAQRNKQGMDGTDSQADANF